MSDERITLRTHLFRDVNPDAACPVCGSPSWAHDPGQVVLHSLTVIPPDSLDAAWAEAEAALPEGSNLALALEQIVGGVNARAFGVNGDYETDGPTPAAALRALAAKLREVGR